MPIPLSSQTYQIRIGSRQRSKFLCRHRLRLPSPPSPPSLSRPKSNPSMVSPTPYLNRSRPLTNLLKRGTAKPNTSRRKRPSSKPNQILKLLILSNQRTRSSHRRRPLKEDHQRRRQAKMSLRRLLTPVAISVRLNR